MSVGPQEFGIPELFRRIIRGCPKIVTQSQGMSHLMRGNKPDKLSHQFRGEGHGACQGIYGGTLYKIPVVNQAHHVVIPVDVTFNDLARTGVAHVGTAGVGYGGGFIDNGRVAGIFQAPGRIFFRRGGFQRINGILETGFFKYGLPIVHALDQIGNPFLRG